MSNLVRFWNSIHHVRSKPKYRKAKLKSLWEHENQRAYTEYPTSAKVTYA